MNPTAYMPFFGRDFFADTDGMTDLLSQAFLRALWHYWSQTKCAGLQDDQVFLRKICRVEREDWEDVSATLFDNDRFFTIDESGLWHHEPTRKSWSEVKEKYDKRMKQTAAANEARRKR